MSGPDGPRGVLVTIEGGDGTGKTTQAERLRGRLAATGREVVLTREPGGTAVGERIRALLLDPAAGPHDARTDALLFNAARAQLVAEVIQPALRRGAIVVSTRFADSTLAYQGHAGGIPLDELRAVERVATGGLRPDLTIVLDLPVEVGLVRKTGDELTRFETAFDAGFHQAVREGFLALAATEPDRFVVVDAAGTPDEVAERISGAVSRAFAAGGAGTPRPPARG